MAFDAQLSPDPALALRVRGEFEEMPCLRLTSRQAARLFGVDHEIALSTLDELREASFLSRADNGSYYLTRLTCDR